MEDNNLRDLESLFVHVGDPRRERTKRHRLRNIILLAICRVIYGTEGWVEIEEFGKAKEAFFLPIGIPSHDTFGRVFALIDPKQFETSFVQWVAGISETVKGVIAIDGKTLRRSHDQAAASSWTPFRAEYDPVVMTDRVWLRREKIQDGRNRSSWDSSNSHLHLESASGRER